MTSVILGIIGTWLLSDGVFSIFTYPGESWWRNHSIRLVRIGLALMLMAMALWEAK